jgi:hypothetical protein
MTALLVIAMASPLWLGFGAIGWQVYRHRHSWSLLRTPRR